MAKFNCVIVDPDMPGRMRLKQATTPINEFGMVTPLGSTNEASTFFKGEKLTDVVFLSERLPQDQIAPFIQMAKQTRGAQDAAYVIVKKDQGNDASAIAEVMMLGGDGLLCEPYSVDSLLEITLLSARVRRERAGERQKLAVGIMVKDLISQLDLVCCLKANNCELGLSIRKLKDVAGMIHALDAESRAIYFEVMQQAFIDAPLPPKALGTKRYGGVSNRVKRKMDQKLAEEIEKHMATGPVTPEPGAS